MKKNVGKFKIGLYSRSKWSEIKIGTYGIFSTFSVTMSPFFSDNVPLFSVRIKSEKFLSLLLLQLNDSIGLNILKITYHKIQIFTITIVSELVNTKKVERLKPVQKLIYHRYLEW